MLYVSHLLTFDARDLSIVKGEALIVPLLDSEGFCHVANIVVLHCSTNRTHRRTTISRFRAIKDRTTVVGVYVA